MVWNEMYVFGVPKIFCFFWSVCFLWQLCRTSMSYYMSSFLNYEQLYTSRHETNVLLFRKFRFNISTQKQTQEQARSSSLSISPLSIYIFVLFLSYFDDSWLNSLKANLNEVLKPDWSSYYPGQWLCWHDLHCDRISRLLRAVCDNAVHFSIYWSCCG